MSVSGSCNPRSVVLGDSNTFTSGGRRHEYRHPQQPSAEQRTAALGRRSSGSSTGALLLAGSLVGWTPGGCRWRRAPLACRHHRWLRRPALPLGDDWRAAVTHTRPSWPASPGGRDHPLGARGSHDQPGACLTTRSSGSSSATACRGPRPQMPSGARAAWAPGVIVRADGYILTNHHVVDGAEQVHVELTDGRRFKATVVGSDAPSDLAVLKIDAHGPADPAARGLRPRARRRRRAGGRQPAGRRPDRHDGHRQREGPRHRHAVTAASRTSSRPTRPSTRATRAARW